MTFYSYHLTEERAEALATDLWTRVDPPASWGKFNGGVDTTLLRSAPGFGYVVGEYHGVFSHWIEIVKPLCSPASKGGGAITGWWDLQFRRLLTDLGCEDETDPKAAAYAKYDGALGWSLKLLVKHREPLLKGNMITMDFNVEHSCYREYRPRLRMSKPVVI
ncbi:hypothetical protein C8R47DRAFT_1207239 [Mycena vitilis]|nr:hypothetical protein C8R47DRAFT_1207239 [Mycena vitilis]